MADSSGKETTGHAIARAIPLRRKLAYTAIVVGAALLFAELLLRLLGQGPWPAVNRRVTITPAGMYQVDPDCGYGYVPGQYKFEFRSGYDFTATINDHGRRITRQTEETDEEVAHASEERPEIWLFGCSFTFGLTVEDNETFAWLLQERFPERRIVNYAVDGYGTVQSLVQLRRELTAGRRPCIVVLGYLSFHDVRSIAARQHLKNLRTAGDLAQAKIPYGVINRDGELRIERRSLGITPWPLIGVSSLVHTVERAYNALGARLGDGERVGAAAIEAMSEECRDADVKFLLAGLNDAPRVEEMLAAARDRGDAAVMSSVDTSRPEYNNLPHDGHPSAVAHQKFAAMLGDALASIDACDAAIETAMNGSEGQ